MISSRLFRLRQVKYCLTTVVLCATLATCSPTCYGAEHASRARQAVICTMLVALFCSEATAKLPQVIEALVLDYYYDEPELSKLHLIFPAAVVTTVRPWKINWQARDTKRRNALMWTVSKEYFDTMTHIFTYLLPEEEEERHAVLFRDKDDEGRNVEDYLDTQHSRNAIHYVQIYTPFSLCDICFSIFYNPLSYYQRRECAFCVEDSVDEGGFAQAPFVDITYRRPAYCLAASKRGK